MPDRKLLTGHVVDTIVGRGVGAPGRMHVRDVPLPDDRKPLKKSGRGREGGMSEIACCVNMSFCVASVCYLNCKCKWLLQKRTCC